MDFGKILETIALVGSDTPAFKALFDQAVLVFSSAEQEQLKEAYARARQRSDEAQEDFTAAGRGEG